MTPRQTIRYFLRLARLFHIAALAEAIKARDPHDKFAYANDVRADCYRHAAYMMGSAVGLSVKVKER